MSHPRSLQVILGFVALILSFQLAVPQAVLADEPERSLTKDRNFNIRGFLMYNLVAGESDVTGSLSGTAACLFRFPFSPAFAFAVDFHSEVKAESKNAIGAAASCEYLLFDQRVGLEAGGMYLNNLIEYEFKADYSNPNPPPPGAISDVEEKGGVDAYMIALALNYHLTPNKKIDVYGGPVLAPAIDIAGTDAIDVGRSVALGFNVGADYLTSGKFMISAKFSFIDFGKIEVNEGWGLLTGGKVAQGIDCGARVYSGFEAKDDLRFIALMIGGGVNF